MSGGRGISAIFRKKWAGPAIFVVLGALLTAGILFAFGLVPAGKKPPAPVAKGDVTCLGRLVPGGRILQVAAPPGAIVGELLVKRGDWVEQGQVLLRLRDHARESAALIRAEKEVAVAASELDRVQAGEKADTIQAQQAAVARAEAVYAQKQAHYERMRKLYDKKTISSREFEEVQMQRDAADKTLVEERQQLAGLRHVRKEDVTLAASKVGAATGAAKVARENVDLNTVRAPVSGQVLDIYAFAGEAVPAGRGVLELGRGRDMMVEAEVYVSDIARVRIGAQALVSGDAFRGSVTGKVVEIVSMVNRSVIVPVDPLAYSDARIVKVYIRLDDSRPVAALGNHQVSVTIRP